MTEANFLWFLSAGIVTAVLHASLPNHWFPFVAAARYHKWTTVQLFRFTLMVALAHAATTVGLSVLVGLLGEGVAHFLHENSVKVAGIALLVLALVFLFSPRLYGHRHIHHPECEHCREEGQVVTLAGLFVALAFSPCEGLLPIFFAAAVKFGWLKTLVIAAISSLLTVVLIVTVVLLANKGWEKFLPQLSERHERLLAAALMAILGISLLSRLWH
ncbi:MAG: hypothetical protein DFNUSKGM_002665 [Candidatus Fervidibacter sacchari]